MPTRAQLVEEGESLGLKGIRSKKKQELEDLVRSARTSSRPSRPTSDEMEHKTMAQLKELIRQEHLDVRVSQLRKAELIEAIRKARTQTGRTGEKRRSGSPKARSPRISPTRNRVQEEKEEIFSTTPSKLCLTSSPDVKKFELFPHQERVVEHMEDHRGLLVAQATGTGKTGIAVIAAIRFVQKYPSRYVMFITPVSLQGNMRKEIKAFGYNPYHRNFRFYTLDTFAQTFHRNPKGCKDAFLIFDEAHNLRTPLRPGSAVQRSKVAVYSSIYAAKVLLLTATPIYNSIYDIKNLMAIVQGQAPPDKSVFESLITSTNIEKYFGGYLSMYYPERGGNYPTLSVHREYIPMNRSFYEKYKKVENSEMPRFDSKNPFIFYTGVRRASNSILGDTPKTKWVVQHVQSRGLNYPVLIYSFFKASGIRVIQERFQELGIPYEEITGNMSEKQRDAVVRRQNQGKFTVLFITSAGGEGLDLKGIRDVILFEPTWNPAREEQIIGRARRFLSHTHLPSRQQHVSVYKLILHKPGEIRDGKIMEFKVGSADVILQKIIDSKVASLNHWNQVLQRFSIEQYTGTFHEIAQSLRGVQIGKRDALDFYQMVTSDGNPFALVFNTGVESEQRAFSLPGLNYERNLVAILQRLSTYQPLLKRKFTSKTEDLDPRLGRVVRLNFLSRASTKSLGN